MRTYITLLIALVVAGCGSANDMTVQPDMATGGSPDVETTGGSMSLAATGGNVPTLTGSGGGMQTGGQSATGGAGSVVAATGGQNAGTGGDAATGGQAPACVGSLGCACPIDGSVCADGLACHPMLQECVNIPVCAGYRGSTCLYGPCNPGLVCSHDLPPNNQVTSQQYTCVEVTYKIDGSIDMILVSAVNDCRTNPAPCTIHVGC